MESSDLNGSSVEESPLAGSLQDTTDLDGSTVIETAAFGTLDEGQAMAERGYVELYRGEGRTIRITIRDRYRQPKDLTDYDLQMDVRDGEDETADLLFSKSTGDGITLEPQSGTTIGQALIVIAPEDTGTVPESGRSYRFDVWARPPGGVPVPVVVPSEFRVLARISPM